MKAFVFCASIFLFAAANASPFYGGYYGRSDDLAIETKVPDSIPSFDGTADWAPAPAPKNAFAAQLVIKDAIKKLLGNIPVTVVKVHPRPVEEEIRPAELWEDSCKKCSQIDYVENTIIKDDINDEDRNRSYCPFTLMDDDEKGKYLANKKRIKKSILGRNEYGTF